MTFYKETNFKETPIERIPKDWSVVKLRDIGENKESIVAGPFGSNLKVKDYTTEGVPIIRLQNIERNKFINENIKYTSPEKAKELSYHSFQPGDLVLAKLGDPIGKTCIVPSSIGKGIVVADVVRIRSSPKKAINKFIEYMLNSNICYEQLRKETIGSTRPRTNITQIRNLKLPLPPLPEQQKIAEVLSTVDKVIEKVGEVIAKTERLKKGLMQELLTKGIGHKEFKDTEIGRIPKTWEVVRLGDKEIAQIRGTKKLNGFDKVAFITMELVPDSGISAQYEIRDINDVKSYTYCEAGDLLLSKITPCFENGKQGVVPFDVPNGFALATTEVFPIICQGIDRLFLFYILKFNKFRKVLEFSMRGTTGRQRVPKDAVERLRTPLPPIEEQEKIVRVLLTVDKKLEVERNHKTKLERIKQGLMDLFLTGKIRIKVNLHVR